ncbi:M56 family metallopeptidase [Stenotrophomonas sp. 24(2023)]|uniref:M56 family metallopeptidase n=1 Tax=Stenotrophomonas sp. 24(2023) TaxID=3068324 RepID=UPI0027DFA11F|nr:M56 family metallopeptidase [Stenotrophomonas sp. 24(2023)]WMJ71167.1 M56 family metallopeptidase [Stenotrophomonas sp. 24(2023)]
MDMTTLIPMLERLGWTSLQTALLVGLVALLCRALPSLSAATRCRLWWLVSLQAVLGLVWSQPLQLPWLPAAQAMAGGATDLVADAVYPVAPELSAQVLAAAPVVDAGTVASAAPVAWWALALAALWLSGVLLTAWRTVAEWRRCRALLAAAQPCEDAALVDALHLAAEAHGLRRPPQLWTSDRIDAPQVIGPLRPVLLLPTGEHALQGDALDLALTHELQHLQRRDLQWGLLPALAQHLFFFHPLLRLAVREYAQAREEAVDAAVVAQHSASRHAYGRLLLQLGVAPQPHLGVASAAPSTASLKRRLQSLQSRRACPKVLAAALTAVVLAVGIAPMRLVAAPVPPAPPVPPRAVAAPPAPPAPAAPPSAIRPAVPAAPAAPPRAPAPPDDVQDTDDMQEVHSSTMTIVTDGELHLGKAPAQAYVLVDNDHTFATAGIDDLAQARQSAGKGPALWFRDGDKRYLVRDAELIKPLQRVYADAAALGRQQSALGARQGALGREQGELGRRQGELGRQQSQLALVNAQDAIRQANRAIGAQDINRDAAAEAADASRDGDAARRRADAAMAGHNREMERLAAQQAALGSRQAALGGQQAVLGERQARIHAQAAEQVKQVIARALASGKAEQL